MADPTREQLRQLHRAFGEYWDTSPWQALDDLDVVAVEHPSGRYTGYCSVLGSAYRESLSESERAAMRRAGLRYRGGCAWPIFRSLRPGYLPCRLEEDEAVFLAAALDNMTDVASKVSSGDLVLHNDSRPRADARLQ